MKKNKKAQDLQIGIGVGLFLFLFIGGLIVLMLGIDTVEANHLGVKVRWGQIIGVMQPSTQWTGLFTQVVQYDMRIRKASIDLSGDNYAPSKEGQKVYALIDVNYKVKNSEDTVKSLYANIGTDDVIANRLNIDPIITEGFKQATAQYTALDILDKRQEVKEKAIEYIKANFPKDYFELQNIVITNIAFSPEFAKEIEAKQTAIQTALKEQNNLETVKFQQQQQVEIYKAQAQLIELQSKALTDLTIRQKMLDKWNGVLPSTLIITPESNGLFLQLAKGEISSGLNNTEG